MTRSRSRLHGLVAVALTLALVVALGASGASFGADAKKAKGKGKAQAAETVESSPTPTPSPEPTPEPTPYPEFDPATVALRVDLYADERLSAPVYLADDGVKGKKCLYVVERGGTVKLIDADGDVRFSPFLDISKRLVGIGPDQGLHSIAFHPGFARNGRFFVHYTTAKKASIVAEFKGTPCGRANNKPVKTLFNEQQEYINNNGGWIGFGPDGMLYIALGDGGGASPGDPNGNGQTKSTLLAKVLRVDVDSGKRYGIPRNNPYAQKKKGFPPETWAWGLRDPRRASFDRSTGDLWIGDVGQDRLEEVNRIPAGATKRGVALNFGWSHVEGADNCHVNVPDCDPSLYTPPVHTYDKVSPHRAVTGGYVYRGSSHPDLQGVYLFSDFASGYIWGLDADAIAAGFEVPSHQLLDAPRGIVSFGQDDAGELYVVSIDGAIYRLGIDRA